MICCLIVSEISSNSGVTLTAAKEMKPVEDGNINTYTNKELGSFVKAHTMKIKNIETYNVGTGRGLSVLEILNAFETVNDVKVPYEIVGRRAGDIEQVWANPDRANNVLGWKAESTIEDTLRSAWAWQQKLREEGIQ